MRFAKFSCTDCRDECPAEAIDLAGGRLALQSERCTGCMLCVSACPSNGFEIANDDFLATIEKLRKADRPVLSCSMVEDLQSHAKTSCLGYLSEEHFIALLCFIEGGVQINLTGCSSCRNRAVIAPLAHRLASVRAKLPSLGPERLKLVQNETELDFQPVSYSRRQFVLAFRDFALQGRAALLSRVEGETARYYSDKVVPKKRKLLNLALEKCSARDDDAAAEISSGYYYRAVINERCNLCPACAAVCPTGALREGRESGRRTLDFDASRCVGCDLCARFCGSNSIKIEKSRADLTANIEY